jgi:hypothetical protein
LKIEETELAKKLEGLSEDEKTEKIEALKVIAEELEKYKEELMIETQEEETQEENNQEETQEDTEHRLELAKA